MTEIELKFQVPPGAPCGRGQGRGHGHRLEGGAARALLRHAPIAAWARPGWRCACARRAGAGCRRSRAPATASGSAWSTRCRCAWLQACSRWPTRRCTTAHRPAMALRQALGDGRTAADLRHRGDAHPAPAARAGLRGRTGLRPGCAGGRRSALAAVRTGVRAQGRRAGRAGGAGLALGRALRPDAGRAHQGRARRTPGAWRAPGRGGEGPAADTCPRPWTATPHCAWCSATAWRRCWPMPATLRTRPTPSPSNCISCASACAGCAPRCANWARCRMRCAPSGARHWASCSAAWVRRATAMRWHRRCCRRCARPVPPGWSCRVIEAEPAAQAALREPGTTQLWLQLVAFAAGRRRVGAGFRAGGAAAPGAAIQAGAGATRRCSPRSTTRRGTGCASASSGCAT